VQAEALVRNVGAFARRLDLVAAASGRVLNLHALCKDAALGYETAPLRRDSRGHPGRVP